MYLHEVLFTFFVYVIALRLIDNKKSKKVRMIGWLIALTHLYKLLSFITYPNGEWSGWPYWVELVALLLATILINEGLEHGGKFVVIVGIIYLLGNTRRVLFDDEKYYY